MELPWVANATGCGQGANIVVLALLGLVSLHLCVCPILFMLCASLVCSAAFRLGPIVIATEGQDTITVAHLMLHGIWQFLQSWNYPDTYQ